MLKMPTGTTPATRWLQSCLRLVSWSKRNVGKLNKQVIALLIAFLPEGE